MKLRMKFDSSNFILFYLHLRVSAVPSFGKAHYYNEKFLDVWLKGALVGWYD